MLFKKILENESLKHLINSVCSENNIEVCFSEYLQKNSDNVIILKIDDYYSTKNGMHNPPPAIDCLILVKCETTECYNIYLVELKNIKKAQYFDINNIVSKFETTINDFLLNRFKDLFIDEKYCNFKCYFVTDPHKCSGKMTQEEYLEHINSKGLKLDYFLSMDYLIFKNKISIIEPILPTPMIQEC